MTTSQIEAVRISGPRGYIYGAFIFELGRTKLQTIVSDGFGWDHVSVTKEHAVPSWEEMCYVKGLFFKPCETVMQLHPSKENYINCHQYCLHLWRPQSMREITKIRKEWGKDWKFGDIRSSGKIPQPPKYLV